MAIGIMDSLGSCSLEQIDTSAWFPTNAEHVSGAEGMETELGRRYAEALWLGEFHTSLDDFLDYSAVWVHLDANGIIQVLTALSTLVLPRQVIRDRHSARVTDALRQYSSTSQHPLPHFTAYEVDLMRNITRYGPAARIFRTENETIERNGLRRTDGKAHQWSQAMESREFQLQILITLFLLQVASREPKMVEDARDALLGPKCTTLLETPASCAAHESQNGSGAKRRRRKLDKPKRWQGPTLHPDFAGLSAQGDTAEDADDFAWSRRPRKRHTTGMSLEDTGTDVEDVLELQGGQVLDVEHLSKRLEALTDILCLSQVTAGMASELSDLLDEPQDPNPESAGGNTSGNAIAAYFGSAVRKIAHHDEMDDAQWLCANVVEPRFGTSLPRQCALFRSKCFVSLQSGTTPARPSRKSRKPNSNQTLGSSSTSNTISGLSHVLEREQAGRIKLMQAKAIGASSSSLGRGREVDMTRRLARSVSAGSGLLKLGSPPPLLGSTHNTNHAQSQRSFSGILPASHRSRKPLTTQRNTSASTIFALNSPEKPASVKRSDGAEPSNRLLVLSTPHKGRPTPTVAVHGPGTHNNNINNNNDNHKYLGAKMSTTSNGLGGRSASFGGLFRRELSTGSRSPSPIAFGSDVED